MRFACLFFLSRFPLSKQKKTRRPCNFKGLRVFASLEWNFLRRGLTYVLRVAFSLVKMGISLTAATVSGVFATKEKIAFCASGYNVGADNLIQKPLPTENGIQVSVGLDNLAQLYLIGLAIVIVAVSTSSITVMRLKPREILSKMS